MSLPTDKMFLLSAFGPKGETIIDNRLVWNLSVKINPVSDVYPLILMFNDDYHKNNYDNHEWTPRRVWCASFNVDATKENLKKYIG